MIRALSDSFEGDDVHRLNTDREEGKIDQNMLVIAPLGSIWTRVADSKTKTLIRAIAGETYATQMGEKRPQLEVS